MSPVVHNLDEMCICLSLSVINHEYSCIYLLFCAAVVKVVDENSHATVRVIYCTLNQPMRMQVHELMNCTVLFFG